MSPDNFGWAKEFLTSKALHHLEGKLGHIDFFLTKCYPSDKGMQCPNSFEIQDEEQAPAKGKGSKRRAPTAESEVRRSPRIKKTSDGSKPSGCPNRRCLACSPSPPTLSTKVIKNLGMQLCDMNPESLKDEVLKKRKKSKMVIRKQVVEEVGEQMIDKEEDPEDGSQARNYQ